jgi:hypothetical protein
MVCVCGVCVCVMNNARPLCGRMHPRVAHVVCSFFWVCVCVFGLRPMTCMVGLPAAPPRRCLQSIASHGDISNYGVVDWDVVSQW